MGERTGRRIILIGFSTTGKSRVAEEVARTLGWEHIETDEEIVRLAGRDIDRIFAESGEDYFRQIERQVLATACETDRTVISAGGGAVIDRGNRDLMKRSGAVICLEAAPETIYGRLQQDNAGPVRPLLNVADPLQRIEELKEERQPYYAIADWTVHTDALTIEEVCQEVLRGWYYWNRSHTHDAVQDDLACEVVTPTERYPVFVDWGLLRDLGARIKQAGMSGAVYLLSDESVFSLHGDEATRSLLDCGLRVNSFVVPSGEASKTIRTATQVYDWLVENRAERGDTIITLGGGMVGDLGGFVAATFLRGLSLVHVPTSLIAMVDASIGGKTAVNHPQAKNMIGVFYQPRLVLADVQTLTTLPHREMVSGWAEVIKHGLILDAGFFSFLEANAQKLLKLDPEATTSAIRRSAAIKAEVVSQDEKERGKRTLLNYGHTIAHGLEAATGYDAFLHGEAVSIGMTGAAMLSRKVGLLPQETVERQSSLLKTFGLPVDCPDVAMPEVARAMELDKKVRDRAIRWVLLEGIGRAVIRNDVPADHVSSTLEDLSGPSDRREEASSCS